MAATDTDTDGEDLVGRVVGGYRIEKKLGGGGMGTVYRALDVHLDRPVALKVIRPELATSTDFVHRFKREAKAAARFQHPHSVQVYSGGEADGILFLALELVEGRELGTVLKQVGKLPIARACRIVLQILSVLGKAHELGIVHRDVKPPNVMVVNEDGDDWVKILDFGIAKLKGTDQDEKDGWTTRSGMILGTPAYMSPEQASAEPVDARSDLYSAAIILYELLAGETPFPGASPAQILFRQMRAAPDPLRQKRPDVPEAIEAVIHRGLEKDPAARYQDARSFAAALEGALLQSSGSRTAKPPPASLLGPRVPTGRTGGPPGMQPARGPGAAPAVGSKVGRYKLEAEIGRGATGIVFRARHSQLDEIVALKVVHAALASQSQRRERLVREIGPVLDLVHPGAVFVREAGWEDGVLFVAQDHVAAPSVLSLVKTSRMPEERALRIVRQCLAALEAAHALGIVHGRLASSNVLVERDPTTGADLARLSDFGCAALGETPASKLDPMVDVRGAGALLHELVTGKVGGPSAEFNTLYSTDVSPAVDELIRKALLARPGSGPQSARELGQAIDAIVHEQSRAETVATAVSPTGVARPAPPLRSAPAPAPPRAAAPPPPPPPSQDEDADLEAADLEAADLDAGDAPPEPGSEDTDVAFASVADWQEEFRNEPTLQGEATSVKPAARSEAGRSPRGLAKGSVLAVVANWGSNDLSVVPVQPATGAASGETRHAAAGSRPVWVALDADEKHAYVANEASNEISIYSIDRSKGTLARLEKSPKAGKGTIAVALHPQRPFAYAANSRSDDVSVFRVDKDGMLSAAGPARPAGKNPRSLAVDPQGRFLFVANYRSNNLSVYEIDSTGDLKGRRTVVTGTNPRAVVVEPSGRFAFVVNSGSNNVSVIAIESTGDLKEAGRSASTGASPRSIAVDPSGRFAYVANSRSNDVAAYAIHPASGRLTSLGGRVPAGNGPLAVAIDPTGALAFVVSYYTKSVLVFRVTPGSGELQSNPGSIAVGTNPYAIAVINGDH